MPTLSYPGVYVEEIPSGVHTIMGVSTSNTAFVDYFAKGPVGVPTRITNLAEFNRVYGGLDPNSEASFAVLQYFLNGGQIAYVLRLTVGAAKQAQVILPTASSKPSDSLLVQAINQGAWGNALKVSIESPPQTVAPHVSTPTFILNVELVVGTQVIATERYTNLSMSKTSPNYAPSVINNQSQLIQVTDKSALGEPPGAISFQPLTGGNDGTKPGPISDPSSLWPTAITGPTGLATLRAVPVNVLCLPITALYPTAQQKSMIQAGQSLAKARRAFYVVDPPTSTTVGSVASMIAWFNTNLAGDDGGDHSALYYPRIQIADPSNAYRPREVGASGAVAGVYARTDSNRGVWKAPAGTDAALSGATIVSPMTDDESGQLNQVGIDGLRFFPTYGNLVWGARTLEGGDEISSDYKYIPVRRLTSFIEQSLIQGTKWAVFEPNDATLWASLRLSVGDFMADLAGRGAFYRYFVQCDSTTTTQYDIDRGICNIVVAFAPVKPAEFIVLQIQQLAGQATS